MALRGSLDDFNIVNILQMIKLENKTGKLSLNELDDQVNITFDDGKIVYAEGTIESDEKRLQSTLLSNYMIRPEDWKAIETEHENRLTSYWDILPRYVNHQALSELISRQVVDNVYYALRWSKGTYEFTPMKSVTYNKSTMPHRDVDGMLMDGVHVADLWVKTSAYMPPMGTYVEKNIMGEVEAGGALDNTDSAESREDFIGSLEHEILTARGVSLTDQETKVLAVLVESKTIDGILNSARQNKYDSLQACQSLLKAGIIKEVRPGDQTAARKGNSKYSIGGLATVLIIAAVVVAGVIYQLIAWPDGRAASDSGSTKVMIHNSEKGLKKIEHAIKIYIALSREYPDDLNNLVNSGVLQSSDIVDPWGRDYELVITEDRFSLFSHGPDDMTTSDNIYLPAN